MRTWPIGTRVYIVGNVNNHNYTMGKAYLVEEVDDDGTFRAKDPETGVIGNWLRWQDVDSVAPVGWQWVKTVLNPETVKFLEAFDGIEQITLRDSVKTRLMQRLPNLFEAIIEESGKMQAEALPQQNTSPPKRNSDAFMRRFFSGVELDAEDELAS